MASDDERIMGGLATARRLQEAGHGAGRADKHSADVDAGRLVSGQAWDDFCNSLRDAGQLILQADQPDDPRVRAEGFRFLLGLVKVGVAQAGELSERDFPKFLRILDGFSKWGAENADNHYIATHIDSASTYRIRGRRGSCMTFLIEVREGFMQLGDTRDFANLTADQIEVEADGSFEILASQQEQPGNWLPLDPDARQIVIRQYFADWENEEPAHFTIERIGSEGLAPEPLTPAKMAAILDDAGNWVRTSTEFWGEWVPELRRNHVPGELAPTRKYVGGAEDIRYGNDYFYLGEDEALVVTLTPPEADYWGIQLCNPWFVTPDYANHVTSLNHTQLSRDSDGLCRVVISSRDPGVQNWLDTQGAREGVVMVRYVWTANNPLPQVARVPFGEIRAALAEDTPPFTAAERRSQIAVRQRAVARRETVD